MIGGERLFGALRLSRTNRMFGIEGMLGLCGALRLIKRKECPIGRHSDAIVVGPMTMVRLVSRLPVLTGMSAMRISMKQPVIRRVLGKLLIAIVSLVSLNT